MTASRKTCTGADGFALIEALVALVLLVLTVGLVAALLAFGQRVASRASAREGVAHLANGSEALAAWLASASPWRPVEHSRPAPVLFEGRPDRMGFVSTSAGAGQPAGLLAVTVGFGGHKTGQTGAILFDAVPLAPGESALPDRVATTPLVGDVLSATFSYFGAPRSGTAPGWRDEWTAAATLPQLVALDAKIVVGACIEDFHLTFRVRPQS